MISRGRYLGLLGIAAMHAANPFVIRLPDDMPPEPQGDLKPECPTLLPSLPPLLTDADRRHIATAQAKRERRSAKRRAIITAGSATDV